MTNFLEPWVLLRLAAGVVAFALFTRGAMTAQKVLRHFDVRRATEGQLALEKQLEGTERPRLEQVLRRCAVADVLTADLAVALTREPAAPQLLWMLEERGLGAWERRPAGRVFVLFPVVRTFVAERVREEHPDEWGRAQLAAARWYLTNGYPVEALRHAVGAGVALPDACRMVATTPARAIGLGDQVGALVAGLRADLVMLDDDLNVVRVMRGGDWVE